jgi:hypothetical protein
VRRKFWATYEVNVWLVIRSNQVSGGSAHMNALPTKQRCPTSVAALQAEVAALHRGLAEAHRARDAARASRPRLIVEGDEIALAENEKASKLAERELASFSGSLVDTREALRLAQRPVHAT